MKKKILLVFLILTSSGFTFPFQKKYENHWSVKAIEEINRIASHGLLLSSNKDSPNIIYKQYKKTSKYITSLHYVDNKGNHYLAISIIDESKKVVLSSQLTPIFNKPEKIYFDIDTYQFISNKIIFGVIVKTGVSSSVDFFKQKKLFIYSYGSSGIKILINGLQLYSKNSWRGAGCTSGYTEKNMKISQKTYTNEYPKIIFKGELKRGGNSSINKDLSNCFNNPPKNGKYKILLNYENNKYHITRKSVYINEGAFSNIYQVSKAIRDNNIKRIIDINPNIDIKKLKINTEILIPTDSHIY